MPFNGVNPHGIVILDNASIHHVQGIVEMINEVGALVLFLPPYSPDFNPIEEAFSKLKALEHLEMAHLDLEDIVLATFSSITAEDCQRWIAQCGIYNMYVVMCSCKY